MFDNHGGLLVHSPWTFAILLHHCPPQWRFSTSVCVCVCVLTSELRDGSVQKACSRIGNMWHHTGANVLFSSRNETKALSQENCRVASGFSPDLNPIEHIWQDLNLGFHKCSLNRLWLSLIIIIHFISQRLSCHSRTLYNLKQELRGCSWKTGRTCPHRYIQSK